MEESVLCLWCANPFLNIIDDKHVDGLIEANEIVGRILQHRIGILHLKQSCADIQHTFLRIQLLSAQTNGVDKMSLATTRRSIDEHRVELCGIRMLGYRLTYRTWQLIAGTFYIIGKREVRVQLWVNLLRLCSIKRSWRLICSGAWFLLNICRVRLYIL